MSITSAPTRMAKPLSSRKYGVPLIVLGALGLVLSYGLAVTKIQLIADPSG